MRPSCILKAHYKFFEDTIPHDEQSNRSNLLF